MTVDIAGSTGVQFSGPFDSKVLQQTERVEAYATAKICELKLFGDWQLKIHFTYNINDVTDERAKEIRLEPSRDRARHIEEEIKEEQNGKDLYGDPLTQHLQKCRMAFKKFATEHASPH